MKDTDLVQFKLMIPAPLKARLEEQAALKRRSLSQEIVVALEEKFPAIPKDEINDPAAKILFWLAVRIRRLKPKSGSIRDRQAALYEGVASDIISRMEAIEEATPREKNNA